MLPFYFFNEVCMVEKFVSCPGRGIFIAMTRFSLVIISGIILKPSYRRILDMKLDFNCFAFSASFIQLKKKQVQCTLYVKASHGAAKLADARRYNIQLPSILSLKTRFTEYSICLEEVKLYILSKNLTA